MMELTEYAKLCDQVLENIQSTLVYLNKPRGNTAVLTLMPVPVVLLSRSFEITKAATFSQLQSEIQRKIIPALNKALAPTDDVIFYFKDITLATLNISGTYTDNYQIRIHISGSCA